MKKNLLFALIGTLTLASCSNTSDCNLANEGVLVVGMECAYQPFNWTETTSSDTNVKISNLDGAYAEGYDVQVAKRLAESLNLELQIKALDWDALIPQLKNKQIDVIIAGMSPTEERKNSIDFTDDYYRSTHVVLTTVGSTYASATKLDDFAGAKVMGQAGTIFAELASQLVTNHGAIQKTNLSTVNQIVYAMKQGQIDCTIVEEPVAKGLVASDPTLTYIKTTDNFIVDDVDVMVSLGIRKGFVLKDNINEFLTNILTSSVRNQLMENAINNAPVVDEE